MTRAAAMAPMDAAAAEGRLALQHCAACGATQYPPRELCHVCLDPDLVWTIATAATGEVLAATVLHHSFEPEMRPRLPLRLGLVRLEQGPTIVCFLPAAEPGASVRVRAEADAHGRATLIAESAS